MKKLLLFAALISLFSPVYAQTLAFEGDSITTDTLVYNFSSTLPEYNVIIHPMNEGVSGIDVGVYRVEHAVIVGMTNNFCWGTDCYSPNVDTSELDDIVFLDTNQADTSFKCTIRPNGKGGTTYLEFCYFTYGNPWDTLCITLELNSILPPINVAELEMEASAFLSKPYPNPAQDRINFNYQLSVAKSGELIVTDLAGRQVVRKALRFQGENDFVNTEGWSPGIYFLNLVQGGVPIASEKVIVRP